MQCLICHILKDAVQMPARTWGCCIPGSRSSPGSPGACGACSPPRCSHSSGSAATARHHQQQAQYCVHSRQWQVQVHLHQFPAPVSQVCRIALTCSRSNSAAATAVVRLNDIVYFGLHLGLTYLWQQSHDLSPEPQSQGDLASRRACTSGLASVRS
jgi:hypothetical protein